MRQTVAVLPGIFSGPYTTRKLRRLLREAGYRTTVAASSADIILAHSAGPLWIPKTPHDQKIIIVNPPYWPGRSIRERAKNRFRSNLEFRKRRIPLRRWLVRQGWGIYYALRNPRRVRYVLHHIAEYNLPDTIHNHNVILVRNKYDDWLTPDLSTLKQKYPKLTVVELPGDHDDFNYNPEHYVKLLQSLT
jgi:hypothetical protein